MDGLRMESLALWSTIVFTVSLPLPHGTGIKRIYLIEITISQFQTTCKKKLQHFSKKFKNMTFHRIMFGFTKKQPIFA